MSTTVTEEERAALARRQTNGVCISHSRWVTSLRDHQRARKPVMQHVVRHKRHHTRPREHSGSRREKGAQIVAVASRPHPRMIQPIICRAIRRGGGGVR